MGLVAHVWHSGIWRMEGVSSGVQNLHNCIVKLKQPSNIKMSHPTKQNKKK